MEKIMEIQNLRKIYRVGDEKIVALNKIDLEIYKGEICCLLGTSGSGKSTLLNMMAGLEKPSRGTVKIKNKTITKFNEDQMAYFRQKHIGFIFQSYNLIQSMTALENVSLPLIFRGVPHKLRKKRALKLLKDVGISKYAKHRPNQMSGGQQQRIGIARAFAANPEIIFADEPTGNLDFRTTKEVMKLMVNIAREKNQTLIIVTHDRSIADYADRVVYIFDGNVKDIEVRNRNTNKLVDLKEQEDIADIKETNLEFSDDKDIKEDELKKNKENEEKLEDDDENKEI
ncbi:MAG: ATP-binding cassette domain-containing protein [Peptostreptococcaceae bacterium]|nr:ATP-binding cassette domain-containing protein [Peptostreptococcaceae bacterium]